MKKYENLFMLKETSFKEKKLRLNIYDTNI